MELLYSNILPLRLSEGQETIADCFNELLSKADSVEIAVGYVSYASLCQLENLVENSNISRICLRLHKFGNLDAKADEGTEIGKLPSFKAMQDFASQDEKVKAVLAEERQKTAAEEFSEPDGDWQGRLDIDRQGRVIYSCGGHICGTISFLMI